MRDRCSAEWDAQQRGSEGGCGAAAADASSEAMRAGAHESREGRKRT